MQKQQGTRVEVFNGAAHHTSGGLTKYDLMLNRAGKIISRRKHELTYQRTIGRNKFTEVVDILVRAKFKKLSEQESNPLFRHLEI